MLRSRLNDPSSVPFPFSYLLPTHTSEASEVKAMLRILNIWCKYAPIFCIFSVVCLLQGSCGPIPPLDEAEALQNYFEGLVGSPHSNLHQILQDHSPPSPLFDLNAGPNFLQAPSSSPVTSRHPVPSAHDGSNAGTHREAGPSATFTDSVRASTGLHLGRTAYSPTADPAMASTGSEPMHFPAQLEGHNMPIWPGSTLHSTPGHLTALIHSFGGQAASRSVQSFEAGASTALHDLDTQTAPLPHQESMRSEVHSILHVSPQHDPNEASAGPSKRPRTAMTDPDPLAPLRTFKTFGRDAPLYKVVLTPDPVVDLFLATLRARIHNGGSGASTAFEELKPIDFSAVQPRNWDLLAVMTFWHRPSAKELFLFGPDGYRRLFVTFMYKPKILSSFRGESFISVWTIAPPQQGTVSSLYLHGLYPFTSREYRQLTRQREAGGDFWITVRHGRPDTGRALKLKVVGMTPEELEHSANVLPRIPTEPNVSSEAMQDEFQAWTSLHPPYGLYFYSYRDDPSILPLVQQWRIKAGLGQNSFEPITLTAEQKAGLNTQMSHVFRAPKRVKVLQLENGETLMLCVHQKMKWLPNSKRAVVSLWKFGAVQTSVEPDGRMYRTLYAVGFFHLSEPNRKRLDSDTIPGLKLSWFQYNHLALPGV